MVAYVFWSINLKSDFSFDLRGCFGGHLGRGLRKVSFSAKLFLSEILVNWLSKKFHSQENYFWECDFQNFLLRLSGMVICWELGFSRNEIVLLYSLVLHLTKRHTLWICRLSGSWCLSVSNIVQMFNKVNFLCDTDNLKNCATRWD